MDLDFNKIVSDNRWIPGTAMFPVFWRNLGTGIIYPNVYTKQTTPNIVACVNDTHEAIPGAKLLQQVGRELLQIPIIFPPAMSIGAVIARYESRVIVRYSAKAAVDLDESILKSQVLQKWVKGGLERPVKVVSKQRGPLTNVRGYITQEKYIKGVDLAEMERRLGLPEGELKDGANVMSLTRSPTAGEFQLRGYTNTPGGQPFQGGPYPPGEGVPQWELIREIPSKLEKFVAPGDTY
ncbi:MAG: hypothetical protein JOY71_05430 [Acetobacteraceae bacterium]|nr:hypothetical protein [Acetobacteraceae bacterium]